MRYGDNTVTLAEQEPSHWFMRLWRRFRPTTGWGVFWLTLGAVLLLPVALVSGALFPGLDPAVTLSVAAFLFGWWLARRQMSGARAAAIVFATGILADLVWGVFVLRPLPLIAQLDDWWTWALGRRSTPEPVGQGIDRRSRHG
jgi:hypothetical protein